MSKSKVICFNRHGKDVKDEFTFGKDKLGYVHTYCYLGIEISSSGSFQHAQRALTYRAMNALFKFKSLHYKCNMTPLIGLK